MKKIFGLVALVLASASVSFAQTVQAPKFFENFYLGVNGGIVTPMVDTDCHGTLGIELGKDLTPVFGLSADWTNAFKKSSENLTEKGFAFDLNLKFNMMNMFGGYKGYPRRVELLLIPSAGWAHNSGDDIVTYNDKDYLNIGASAQMNFNLGQQRAWFITLKTGWFWNEYGQAKIFDCHKGDFRLNAGISYRFGSKRTGSHNFVLCPYSVTKADYDKVVASRDALQEELNKKPKEVIKEVVKENRVEVPVYMPANSYVTFTIGSAVINPVEKIKLKQWVNSVPSENAITIVGSADSKTGSAEYNEKLANKRAEAVKNIIVNECGRDASKVNVETKIDVITELAAASRTAVMEVIK